MEQNDKQPLVAIQCTVYNHESYLRECLDGFVMQLTNFPFVAIVHDDASTDKSADIIREYAAKYPDIIHPIYEEENQYSKGTLSKIMDDATVATGAKYIALCEGDDYWSDPKKLQKQVDFMETHLDYSMCFHKVKVLSSQPSEKQLFSQLEERDYSACEIYAEWTIPTCSVLFLNLPMIRNKRKSVPLVYGDIFLFLSLSQMGKLHCLDFTGATYRRHIGSLTWQMSSSRIMALLEQYKLMEKVFPDLIDITKQYERFYLDRLLGKQDEVEDILKYRLWYCRLNPRLYFHRYFLITMYKYMLCPFFRKSLTK